MSAETFNFRDAPDKTMDEQIRLLYVNMETLFNRHLEINGRSSDSINIIVVAMVNHLAKLCVNFSNEKYTSEMLGLDMCRNLLECIDINKSREETRETIH
jgi:hypothetical protein